MKKFLALILSIAMVLSLAACGETKEPASTDNTTPDTTEAETKVMEKIAIAIQETPTSLDPQVGDLVANKLIWNCTHESLLGIDLTNNTIIPELAYQYDISEDGLTYTFYLNKGVKFHNGEELKAADVVYTFTRANDMPDVSGRIGALESVTALDEYTVEMKLNAVNQDWTFVCADQLFSILNEKACTEDTANGAAIGTGPFYSTLYAQNEKVVVERFDDYWGDAVPTEEITFRVITEASARSVALQNGEVQAITKPDTIELDYLNEDPTVDLIQIPGASLKYLAFNSFDEVTGNQLVRQAIACALDRDAIIAAAVNGLGEPAYTMWGTNVYGYDPSVKTFDYDVEKAKQLLAEAGYPDGVDIEVVCTDAYSVQCQMLQDALKKANINVTINTMDAPGMKTYMLSHENQMSWNSVSYAANADDMRWSYGVAGSGNRGGFVVEKFDELLDVCMSSSDETARKQACTDVQTLNADICWYIPVYDDLVNLAMKVGTTGVIVSNVEIHDFSRICVAE